MAEYTFFTNPMSRGQIARWALHEAGADYQQALVEWTAKPEALLKANPMGKVPTIVHHAADGDHVVTEAAAICHYLAEMHPQANLLPRDAEMADYFRWLFFAAGPLEQAIVTRHFGWEPQGPQAQGMAGFGSFERTMDTLDGWLDGRAFVCGQRFTMADVYLGSQLDWGLTFGTVPPRVAFVAYVERCRARPACVAAKTIDNALIAGARKGT